jgi:hypothetical protein
LLGRNVDRLVSVASSNVLDSPANRACEFNGDSVWILNAQGQPVAQPAVPPATIAGDRQLMLWTTPAGFIQAALADNATVTDRHFNRQNRNVKGVGFTTKVCDGPQPRCSRRVTGEFNGDNLLERAITWVPDPVMGDQNCGGATIAMPIKKWLSRCDSGSRPEHYNRGCNSLGWSCGPNGTEVLFHSAGPGARRSSRCRSA